MPHVVRHVTWYVIWCDVIFESPIERRVTSPIANCFIVSLKWPARCLKIASISNPRQSTTILDNPRQSSTILDGSSKKCQEALWVLDQRYHFQLEFPSVLQTGKWTNHLWSGAGRESWSIFKNPKSMGRMESIGKGPLNWEGCPKNGNEWWQRISNSSIQC